MAAPTDDHDHTGASRTAELAAVSRARHLLRHPKPHIFEDPFAIHLLGKRWRRIVTSRLLDWVLSKIVMNKLVPISIQQLTRARFAEETLEAAARNGVTQYVILGAGFDSFAFRRPDLDLTVFEVDRAAMIRLKTERLAAANLEIPARLHLVPFDFERGDLRDALTAAGFDLGARSFFNWMGVTYYLTRASILDNLDRLAEIASSGSETRLRLPDRGRVRAAGRPRSLYPADGIRGETGRTDDLALRPGPRRRHPESRQPLGDCPERLAGGSSPEIPRRSNRSPSPGPHHLVPPPEEENRRPVAGARTSALSRAPAIASGRSRFHPNVRSGTPRPAGDGNGAVDPRCIGGNRRSGHPSASSLRFSDGA